MSVPAPGKLVATDVSVSDVSVSDTMARKAWPLHLAALAAVIAAIIAVFYRDAFGIAVQWWTASTYQHCLFILPIVAWLVWQRRHEVAPIAPAAWPPGLAAVAAAAALWMLGEAAGTALLRHVALVALLQAAVLAILGPAVARALFFPLFYLVFLIPFGEEFVPALQTVTAEIVIALIRITGMKAEIDGIFITTEAGLFEVAEACSGVKFLVAMVAFGTLVANVCFRSWSRRIVFLALCVVAPILANGVRAFATIYAAHLTSIEAATGFDHILYGWFFFALVMGLVVAAGWRFFDRKPGDAWIDTPIAARAQGAAVWPIALATVVIAAVPVAWTNAVVAGNRVALPSRIFLPEVPGWQLSRAVDAVPWAARFDGADHRLSGRYVDAQGQAVDLAIALYGWQGEGREIVGFAQGAADPNGRWRWAATLPSPAGGKAERLMVNAELAREARTFYLIADAATGDAMTVKLATLRARLFGGDQRAAVIIVSARDTRMQPARAALDAFMRAFGPPEARATALFAQAEGR